MSLLNWLSGNADTEQKLQALDYQVSATNRFILERDEKIQQLRKDIGNLQNNVYEATQLIVMLQQRVYKLEDAAQAAKPRTLRTGTTNCYVEPTDTRKFYEDLGGYEGMRKMLKGVYGKTRVYLNHGPARDGQAEYWRVSFGDKTKQRGSKCKTFKTRLEAERFAFDVLQIHDGECNKRRASTKWWDGVNIFEVTPNRRSA